MRLATSLITASLLLCSCGEEAKVEPATKPAPQPVQPAPETPKASEAAPPAAAAEAPSPSATPTRPTYTVRAQVNTLPGIESSTIRLHHERIPTFAGKDGTVGKDSQGKPGMKPMVMSFARGAGISYEGLRPGDKVEVVVEVDWQAAMPDERIVITKLTKLAPETVLDFEGQRSITDPKPAEPKREPK